MTRQMTMANSSSEIMTQTAVARIRIKLALILMIWKMNLRRTVMRQLILAEGGIYPL
jgi:hypothetical protein